MNPASSTITLPLLSGQERPAESLLGESLVCEIHRPTTGRVARFRTASRQILLSNLRYNQLIDQLSKGPDQITAQGLQDQLDACDSETTQLIIDRVRGILSPVSIVSSDVSIGTNQDQVRLEHSLDRVDWENCEAPELARAVSFFEKSISG